MKKNLIFLLIVLSACSTLRLPDTPASSKDTAVSSNQNNSVVELKNFKGDTLGYVQQNFIDNKQKYIGKDLNNLLNDLEIPIKSYINGNTEYDNTIIPNTIFDFHTRAQVHNNLIGTHHFVNIIIQWAPPLPKDSVMFIWKKTFGKWTDAERKYYGKQIIGDILTTKWNR